MLYKILYLFLLFIIYSFIGWFIEEVAVFIKKGKLINRGFLMGPYCPIYGFGALIMLFILSIYKDDPFLLFIMFAIYASILEYATSYLMEKLFNARWWDYSTVKFNFNGRICLINCLAFGILGLFLGYFINPLITNMLDVIPDTIIYIVSFAIMIIFIIDICITFNVITKLRKSIIITNKDMTVDINNQFNKFIEKNHIFKAFPLLKQTLDKFIWK